MAKEVTYVGPSPGRECPGVGVCLKGVPVTVADGVATPFDGNALFTVETP